MNRYLIPYTLIDQAGNKISFALPYCWEGVSFRQMEKIWNLKGEELFDESAYLEIFTPITREVWEQCDQLDLLFTVNNTLKFLMDDNYLIEKSKQPSNKFTWNGFTREIPADIATRSIGQYKDMIKFGAGVDAKEQASKIPLMIAIYMQPILGATVNERLSGKLKDYDYNEAKQLAEHFKEISIVEILQINSFFLNRSNGSKPGTQGLRGWIMKKLRLAPA